MDSVTTGIDLCKIDLTDKSNLLDIKDIDIGTGARSELCKAMQKCSTTPQLRHQFLRECRDFTVAAVSKLQEKCPVRYKFVRNCGSLSPCICIFVWMVTGLLSITK